MKFREIKIGDHVRVKRWSDMLRANLMDSDGDIYIEDEETYFYQRWRRACGNIAIVKNIDCDDETVLLKFANPNTENKCGGIWFRSCFLDLADICEADILYPGDEVEIMSFEELVEQYGGNDYGEQTSPSESDFVCPDDDSYGFPKGMDILAHRKTKIPGFTQGTLPPLYPSWEVDDCNIETWMVRKIEKPLNDISEDLKVYLNNISLREGR